MPTTEATATIPKTRKPSVKYRTDLERSSPLAPPVRDRQFTFSKQAAYEHLDLARFDGERPVGDSHVQMLLDEHRQGKFNWALVTLVTAEMGGTIYGLNGQHTCWMRVSLPDNSADPTVRHQHYRVADEQALRTLYSIIDRNKARTPGHVLRVLAGGEESLRGLWSGLLSLYASGWKVWKCEEGANATKSMMGTSEVLNEFLSEPDLVQAVAAFIQTHYTKSKYIRRASVVGAMMATFDKAPDAAIQFWTPIATGLGLTEETDARHRLRGFLIEMNANAVGREDVYRVCINGWNKWRDGEKVRAPIRPTEDRRKVK